MKLVDTNPEIKTDMLYGYTVIRPEWTCTLTPVKQTPRWLAILSTTAEFMGGVLAIAATGLLLTYAGIPAEIATQLTTVFGFIFGFGYVTTRI